MVRGVADKRSKQHPARSPVARERNNLSDAAQRKQKWALEKPKLDSARRLRGIYFIDSKDEELKETILKCAEKVGSSDASSNALQDQRRESTGRPVALLILARQNTHASSDESTRKRLEELYINIMKTTLQEKESIHRPVQSCAQICSCASSNENTWSKCSSGQRMWKIEKIPAWQLTKVSNKKRGDRWSKERRQNSAFASLMDFCHLKNSELEPKHQTYQGRVVLRGDMVKADSGSNTAFTEQGSSASQTAAKVNGCHTKAARLRRTSNRRCFSLHPGQKWKRHPRYFKCQNRNVQTFGFVFQKTIGRNHGPVWLSQSFLLNRICTFTLLQDHYGKGNSRKFSQNMVGKYQSPRC